MQATAARKVSTAAVAITCISENQQKTTCRICTKAAEEWIAINDRNKSVTYTTCPLYYVVALTPNAKDCAKRFSELMTSSAAMLLSDVALTSPCLRSGTGWKLQADVGQIFNISLVNFKETSNQRRSCGKVKDVLTGNEVTLTPAARTQKLLVSHGNEIEISFTNDDCRVGLDISGTCRSERL